MQRYVTEAIGTFFLVLTVQCSGGNPLAVGSVLMVMVYMSGHISGGHLNPAVTLAVFLRGKLPIKDVIPYWIFQFAGGFAGALIGWMLVRNTIAPEPAANNLWFHAMVAETLFAFALSLVILNVATCEKTEGNSYYGLAIGFTVAAGIFAVGRVSGGAFNPSVGLGLHLANLFNANKNNAVVWFWIPIIFPFLGGALAAFVYQFQHSGNFSAPGAAELQDKYEANKEAEASTPPPAPGGDKSDQSNDDAEAKDDSDQASS